MSSFHSVWSSYRRVELVHLINLFSDKSLDEFQHLARCPTRVESRYLAPQGHTSDTVQFVRWNLQHLIVGAIRLVLASVSDAQEIGKNLSQLAIGRVSELEGAQLHGRQGGAIQTHLERRDGRVRVQGEQQRVHARPTDLVGRHVQVSQARVESERVSERHGAFVMNLVAGESDTLQDGRGCDRGGEAGGARDAADIAGDVDAAQAAAAVVDDGVSERRDADVTREVVGDVQ